MYTQSLYILAERPITTEVLGTCLRRMDVIGPSKPGAEEHWSRNAPGWILRSSVHPRSRIVVDTMPQRWPDHFSATENVSVYRAWSMGFLGPHITPGCLERARPSLKTDRPNPVDTHTGLVRLRMSYAPSRSQPLVPFEQDLAAELVQLARIAYFILEHDEGCFLFSPAGERITDRRSVWQLMDAAFGEVGQLCALWMSLRTEHSENGRRITRCVGLPQLGINDFAFGYSSSDQDVSRMEEIAAVFRTRLVEGLRLDDDEFRDTDGGRWKVTRTANQIMLVGVND